jgi:hypothetical protein
MSGLVDAAIATRWQPPLSSTNSDRSSSKHAATVAWGFTLPLLTFFYSVQQQHPGATNPGLGRTLPLHTPLQLAPQLIQRTTLSHMRPSSFTLKHPSLLPPSPKRHMPP